MSNVNILLAAQGVANILKKFDFNTELVGSGDSIVVRGTNESISPYHSFRKNFMILGDSSKMMLYSVRRVDDSYVPCVEGCYKSIITQGTFDRGLSDFSFEEADRAHQAINDVLCDCVFPLIQDFAVHNGLQYVQRPN